MEVVAVKVRDTMELEKCSMELTEPKLELEEYMVKVEEATVEDLKKLVLVRPRK